MTQYPEFWTAVNSFFLVILAILAIYTNRNLKVIRKELNGAKSILLNKIEDLSRFKANSTGALEDADNADAAAIAAEKQRNKVNKANQ